MTKITYKDAGVNIEAGDKFVKRLSGLVQRTMRPEVLSGVGPFSALFKLDTAKYREPVLVSGTDGVGTKLKVAFMADVHDTVGIDLVAMCVNDILTGGAEPLFFLDYFATGRLKTETALKVVEGMAVGCEEAGCALIGGETAEMPGFYAEGEYDLAGFAVGVVEKDEIVDGSGIIEGDVLLGIPSSGLHSNGYSLVRKVFFDIKKFDISAYFDEVGGTLGEELLKPTRIYVKAVRDVMKKVDIKGMAHITGGGIPGNVPRALPDGLRAVVKEGSWPEPPVFGLLRALGDVDEDEMRRTFNMGVGFVLVVGKSEADALIGALRQNGLDSYLIGDISKGEGGVVYA